MAARIAPRPTHFLSIPLGQLHAGLRAQVTEFRDQVDEAHLPIVVAPPRIHFTLGVMNLDPHRPESRTVDEALSLLRELPTRLALPETAPIVPLDLLDVLKRNGPRRAHVLHIGPQEAGNDSLISLFNNVHAIFREEGFITETRPLKLHMTLMNTNFNRPRKGRTQPFSFDVVRLGAQALGVVNELADEFTFPQTMSWGAYEASSLHIMGSYGPDGAYVSLGNVPLSRQSA
ncbi:AKAP7 2'5' RNA ligase-like domain-containing protein [Mucidula mucida]|nr:AKAP7 2'5' RNA ligase-like domain-containing protein [Mucidula mucida]